MNKHEQLCIQGVYMREHIRLLFVCFVIIIYLLKNIIIISSSNGEENI